MEPASARFLPQIDGLRAYAIAIVLLNHFWLVNASGALGVRLFFVISGFLITGILLRGRDEARETGSPLRVAGRFYARRALRILPAYYGVLLAAWLYDLGDVRATIWWHLVHASNFLAAVRGLFGYPVGHLWSLSVEEQFYLVWPMLVLLLPRRWLLSTMVALVATGVALRFAICLAGYGPIPMMVLTPTQFDALGAGALLAIAHQRGVATRSLPALHGVAVAGLIAAVAFVIVLPPAESATNEALLLTAFLPPLAWLVLMASLDRDGPLQWLLANPVALYLGKISYGIYLYHLFVDAALGKLCDTIGLPHPPFGPPLLLVDSAVTVLAAMLSWHFFEAPILELKRYFRDPPRPDRLVPAPAGGTSGAG
jgi:peptidoglycan/LPS O-acetylase OafA/YrhL